MSSRIARVIDRALEASIVGSFTNIGSSVRSHLDHWENPASLEGRIVVLTGATSGIGRAAATMLVNLGAELHIVGRSADKVHSTVDALNGLGHHEVTGHLADLALLHDTARLEQTLHETLPRIDVLIHNAGALLTDFTATTEGIETTVVTPPAAAARLAEVSVSRCSAPGSPTKARRSTRPGASVRPRPSITNAPSGGADASIARPHAWMTPFSTASDP